VKRYRQCWEQDNNEAKQNKKHKTKMKSNTEPPKIRSWTHVLSGGNSNDSHRVTRRTSTSCFSLFCLFVCFCFVLFCCLLCFSFIFIFYFFWNLTVVRTTSHFALLKQMETGIIHHITINLLNVFICSNTSMSNIFSLS
jgi:hypothetical protein